MNDHAQHRAEISPKRFENLFDRIERRTRAEHRKQLRNAALASGIVTGVVAGNYYLTGGTVIYAVGFAVVGLVAYLGVLILDVGRRWWLSRKSSAPPCSRDAVMSVYRVLEEEERRRIEGE